VKTLKERGLAWDDPPPQTDAGPVPDRVKLRTVRGIVPVTTVTKSVTPVTTVTKPAGPMTAAERARRYRERKKAR
jgi:hypothetical protein